MLEKWNPVPGPLEPPVTLWDFFQLLGHFETPRTTWNRKNRPGTTGIPWDVMCVSRK